MARDQRPISAAGGERRGGAATDRARGGAAHAECRPACRARGSAAPRINLSDPTQLDCVDETVNTTIYLTLLSREGLLRWHRVAAPAHRGTLVTLDVANTPVLVENGTGKGFAVDTAFADPGLPPYIVPLETWLAAIIPEYRENTAL